MISNPPARLWLGLRPRHRTPGVMVVKFTLGAGWRSETTKGRCRFDQRMLSLFVFLFHRCNLITTHNYTTQARSSKIFPSVTFCLTLPFKDTTTNNIRNALGNFTPYSPRKFSVKFPSAYLLNLNNLLKI